MASEFFFARANFQSNTCLSMPFFFISTRNIFVKNLLTTVGWPKSKRDHPRTCKKRLSYFNLKFDIRSGQDWCRRRRCRRCLKFYFRRVLNSFFFLFRFLPYEWINNLRSCRAAKKNFFFFALNKNCRQFTCSFLLLLLLILNRNACWFGSSVTPFCYYVSPDTKKKRLSVRS